MEVSGSIDARGGADATNGGTLKVFYRCSYTPGPAVRAGRVYETSAGPCD